MKKIKKIFLKDKIMPLDLFLDRVLYDKEVGYYQNKNPFGIKGDYITAPNISKLFCEMISIWIVSFWENLDKPKKFNFVELGPGNGDFCLVLLETLKNFPETYKAINIFLYEKSNKLRKIQKKRITSKKVFWLQNLKKIKDGPIIFFGNEFLDALPIKQFKKINNKFFEKYVVFKDNQINFLFKKAIKKELAKLKSFKLLNNSGLIEYPEYGFREMSVICEKVKKLNGGILFIDYGYKYQKNINSLQSVIRHKLNDVKKNLGNADITSLVNFELYKDYFNSNNLIVEKIISQSKFLQKMGIVKRYEIASNKMNNKDKTNLYLRVKRLIDPKLMGENFKVIFAKNKKCSFTLPFN